MNWLAHLFLSQPSGEHRLGNLLGDLVKGKERAKLNSCFDEGLKCHQSIDRFTDSHSLVKISKRRINNEHRRYSGILIDVFYDHFLARNWHLYSQIDLATFNQQVYSSLLEPLTLTSPRGRTIVTITIEQDWLGSSYDIAGIEATLTRIKYKLSARHQNYFQVANFLQELDCNYRQLEQDFLLFFPELINHIEVYNRYLIEEA